MFDLGLVQQVVAVIVLERVARGGIEDLFLDGRVDGQLGADVLGELLAQIVLAIVVDQLLVGLEQRLHFLVVIGQQLDRVDRAVGVAGRGLGLVGPWVDVLAEDAEDLAGPVFAGVLLAVLVVLAGMEIPWLGSPSGLPGVSGWEGKAMRRRPLSVRRVRCPPVRRSRPFPVFIVQRRDALGVMPRVVNPCLCNDIATDREVRAHR